MFRNLFKTLPVFILFLASIVQTALPQDALLWEIKGNNRRASYLYGTIHLKDKRVFGYADTTLKYMLLCDRLALEIDLNPTRLMQSSGMMLLKSDSTLKDVFNGDDFKIISAKVEQITGMNFDLLVKLKPVALLSVVLQSILPCDMPYTLDEFFYQKALEQKMKFTPLETFEEQFRLLETIPLESVTGFLKNPGTMVEDIEPLIQAYTECDIDKLLNLMQKDETMVSLKKGLLDDRNYKMAEKITALIQQESLFIAVGAGHLPGPAGLINLLKEKGYIVNPVIVSGSIKK
ncbi:MAG: TraB/GumN family protein [Bacteroidales bacterium]|nr:TraB/GumN family protein [Bacteroidales bacterium]